MNKFVRMQANGAASRSAAADAGRARRTHYFAFLSYSHKDHELADWLQRELEAFRVPPSIAGRLTDNGAIPRRLVPIFRDEHDLAAAHDLGQEIQEALASSQFLIVLCSPSAAQSHWTNAEVELFKRTRPEGCVLAAIASGEPFASEMPGREAEECFPPALRQKYDRRGRPTGKRAEPLAADFRPTSDGRRLAFLKLVAGMLDVPLDELVQRETTRRHRRLAWLAAASIGGMAVTSTLAVTAIQSRNEAREQRREAEGLVAFMLGDLKDKLAPIGRLDALDGVGSRVLAYYSKQDTSELSDAALLQRSRALSLMAGVAYERGDFSTAGGLYEQALGGTAEAVQRNPSDPQRLFEHAQNAYWLGDIAMQRGDRTAAERWWREYKRLAAQMVAIDPDNMKWRMEVQNADANLGILLYRQRRFAEASAQYQQALQTIEALATADPRNDGYQKSLVESLGWLADAKQDQGRLDEALALRARTAALLQQRSKVTGDVDYQQRLVGALRGLGNVHLARGNVGEALKDYQAAIALGQKLIATEPDNSRWLDATAKAQLGTADALLSTGRAAEAATVVAAACAGYAHLISKEPDVPGWREGNRNCLVMKARAAISAGNSAEGASVARQAVVVARSIHSTNAVADAFGLARALRVLGDAYRAGGDMAAARQAWAEADRVRPAGVPEAPLEMREHARIAERLGHANELAALNSRLAAMGYRAPG